MLALQTTEDWALSLTVDVGGLADTWAPTDVTSAYEAMEALTAWASANARPWANGTIFTWSWDRDPNTGGALLSLHATATFTLTPDAVAQARLGFGPAGPLATHQAWSKASGTWAPGVTGHLSVQADLLMNGDRGDASQQGAIRTGVAGLAGRAPRVTAAGDPLDWGRLLGIAAVAANPRRAWVYQLHRDTWVLLALGRVRRQQAGHLHWRADLDTAGESV